VRGAQFASRRTPSLPRSIHPPNLSLASVPRKASFDGWAHTRGLRSERVAPIYHGIRRWRSPVDEREFEKVLRAMLERGDRRWNTPSGAILDLLRDFASQGKLTEIAEACRLYISAHPTAKTFVAGALPAIILNNYEPFRKVADFDKFLQWTSEKPDWAESIAGNAMSDRLAEIVDNLAKSLAAFRKRSPG
jgi:hypothetical protein